MAGPSVDRRGRDAFGEKLHVRLEERAQDEFLERLGRIGLHFLRQMAAPPCDPPEAGESGGPRLDLLQRQLVRSLANRLGCFVLQKSQKARKMLHQESA